MGLTIARKPGKLPFHTIGETYDLEYGSAGLEVHEDGMVRGARVLIVDDLLATGGTAEATVRLAQKLQASIVSCAFVIELAALGGASVSRRSNASRLSSMIEVTRTAGAGRLS